MLSRRTIPGSVLQSCPYLTPMDAYILQVPIAEAAQEGRSRLALTLSDDACDPPVNEPGKPSCDGVDCLPSVGTIRVAGVAAQ
jgi:hypothetical protein